MEDLIGAEAFLNPSNMELEHHLSRNKSLPMSHSSNCRALCGISIYHRRTTDSMV
ncbi:hypothetical protein CCACVL1_03812 [Corchorus capsularis]|uniref:Uncharacterized protein n=1 Tax=Corchorus capsularis TaxID=210143 RepID=A0A1R3JX57_COCAP|nr:hypothetical protein CCACVL1_03812 [Corchorus capsularis]